MKNILSTLLIATTCGAAFADDTANYDGMYIWQPEQKDFVGYYNLMENPQLGYDGKNITILNGKNVSGSFAFREGLKITFGSELKGEPSGGIHETAADDSELSTEGGIIFGDVNGDAALKMSDANLIVNYLSGKRSILSKEQADIDGDGMVTLADAKVLQSMYVGKETDLTMYNQLVKSNTLKGTFNTYLMLFNDLGLTELLKYVEIKVLSPESNYTIFPANDDAFARFFAGGKNVFGKSSYAALTMEEKAQLLAGTIGRGSMAWKQLTEKTAIISSDNPSNHSQFVLPKDMPENNRFFADWKNNNQSQEMSFASPDIPINLETADGDLIVNGIKVMKDADTGKPVGRMCQNGFVYQTDEVTVANKSIAQMIRENGNMKHLARMLGYYAVPVKYYKDFSPTSGLIYQVKYLSKVSQNGSAINYHESGIRFADDMLLDYDPGCFIQLRDGSIVMPTLFAPNDKAIENYFATDGNMILKSYGVQGLSCKAEDLPMTLDKHLDALYNNNPVLMTSLLNGIMAQGGYNPAVTDYALRSNNDVVPVAKENIARDAAGRYMVQKANNGTIYEMDKMMVNGDMNSVIAPVVFSADTKVMAKILNDHQTSAGMSSYLEHDMYYYLTNPGNNYAVFVPKDGDGFYYIDPTSKDDYDGMKALKFSWTDDNMNTYLNVLSQKYYYNKGSNTLGEPIGGPVSIDRRYYNSIIKDMLENNIISLGSEGIQEGKNYYMTKGGSWVYMPDLKAKITETISSGNDGVNGSVYMVNTPVQPVTDNVYTAINRANKYGEFLDFCENFSDWDVMYFAFGYGDYQAFQAMYNKYQVFGENNNLNVPEGGSYTIFVPQYMEEAYANGLPQWDYIRRVAEDWQTMGFESEEAARAYVTASLSTMRRFVMRHIAVNAKVVDGDIWAENCQTLCMDAMGNSTVLKMDGKTVSTNIKSNIKEPNIMAREVRYEERTDGMDINRQYFNYKRIKSTTSFVIHGIDHPLYK